MEQTIDERCYTCKHGIGGVCLFGCPEKLVDDVMDIQPSRRANVWIRDHYITMNGICDDYFACPLLKFLQGWLNNE